MVKQKFTNQNAGKELSQYTRALVSAQLSLAHISLTNSIMINGLTANSTPTSSTLTIKRAVCRDNYLIQANKTISYLMKN